MLGGGESYALMQHEVFPGLKFPVLLRISVTANLLRIACYQNAPFAISNSDVKTAGSRLNTSGVEQFFLLEKRRKKNIIC